MRSELFVYGIYRGEVRRAHMYVHVRVTEQVPTVLERPLGVPWWIPEFSGVRGGAVVNEAAVVNVLLVDSLEVFPAVFSLLC